MIVSWMTTNKCNLRCSHCYQDAGEAIEKELSTEEAKAMIDGIANAGFHLMIFSGGEPLMREDIFELVQYASSKRLRPVFGTNGTLLTKETVRKLKECGASTLGISLDSLDPQKHDNFRGVKGSFEQTLEGIRNCNEAGLPFQIHTTVLDWNKDELSNIIDFASSEGAKSVYVFFLIPVGRGVFLEESALETKEYEKLLQLLMKKQKELPIVIKPTCAPQYTRVAAQLDVTLDKRFSKGCLAGISYCVVSPSGTVRPCAYMTEPAGDIRQKTFDQIWSDSDLFHRLRTRDYDGTCGKCKYKDCCGGCRARAAYYDNGNILGEDPYCAYNQSMKKGI